MREQFLVEIEQIGEMVAGSKCTLKQSQKINKLLEKLATTIITRIEIAKVNPTSSEQLAAPDVVQRTCYTCLYCQINPSSEGINDRHKCMLHEPPMIISDNTTHTCDDWTEIPF